MKTFPKPVTKSVDEMLEVDDNVIGQVPAENMAAEPDDVGTSADGLQEDQPKLMNQPDRKRTTLTRSRRKTLCQTTQSEIPARAHRGIPAIPAV